jgi:hypothetical protein
MLFAIRFLQVGLKIPYTFALIMGKVKIQSFHVLSGNVFFATGIVNDQESDMSLIFSFGLFTMDSFLGIATDVFEHE